MGRLRIAFSGGGLVSDAHAAAIRNSSEATLVGVFDTNADTARRRSDEWRCRRYMGFEEMVASGDVDAIFVLSPPRFHVPQAVLALRGGKHVLVEKPVGPSVAEVHRLASVARRSNRVCMPGHTDAYVPEFQRVKALVKAGRLGEIRLLAMMYSIAHTEEVAAHYEGALRTVMPHHAYVMHGMLGLPEYVSCGVTDPAWRSLSVDDQCWMVLDYPPHTTAILFAGMAADDHSADPWSCVVKAIGTRGSASGSWRTGYLSIQGEGVPTGYAPVEDAFARELHAFVHAARGDDSEIASSIEEAEASARILEAAIRATRTGRRVRVRRNIVGSHLAPSGSVVT